MLELTASTREAARRIGVSDTAIHKAERAGRITREPDGNWDIEKTRRRLTETADPSRSPLANSAEGTPFGLLKVAQLALKVEAQRLSLDETKRRLVDVTEANAALDEIGSTMRASDRLFAAEYQRASGREHAAHAVADGDVHLAHLGGRGSSHLAHALLDREHSVHASVGVA